MLKRTLTNFFIIWFFGLTAAILIITPLFMNWLNGIKAVADTANIFEIGNALEIYYFDNQHYPATRGGSALINELFLNGYIKNKPADASLIYYEPYENGEDYSPHL